MIFKKDDFLFGLALGLLAPVVGFMVFKLYKFSGLTIKEMFEWMKLNPKPVALSTSPEISISLLANAILFTIYINNRKDKTAKGIFVLTVLYAIVAFIFKYY